MLAGVQDETVVERRPGMTERGGTLEHDVIDLTTAQFARGGKARRTRAHDDGRPFLD